MAGEALTNRFGAAGSALGYLAQIEYGLLLALRRMDTTEDGRVSLETMDDIVFDDAEGNTPRELWQSKHHLKGRGSLGDASTDIWKSLHNWIETSDSDCELVLFSTASAPAGSAANLLGADRTRADVEAAHEKLLAVARAKGNTSHAAYYDRFLSLSATDRNATLNRLTILDGAVAASDITNDLTAAVRKAVRADRRLSLIRRLRGWWHERALQHLTLIAEGRSDWIEMIEVEHELHKIAQSLRDQNLPLDYSDYREPTSEEVEQDDRIFVEQLRLIMLHHERIRLAIYDHNRAFLQRSEWQRENLLDPAHLKDYDRRLIAEWKRAFLPASVDAELEQDDAMRCRAALDMYLTLEKRALPEVRPEIRSGYIPQGSLHILADRLEIGWHPDWLQLLRHRLDSETGEEGVA